MKARAMIVTEPGRLEYREWNVTDPPPGYILVRTLAASVCATDVKVYHGKTASASYPLVMGHEFVGEVVKIGDDCPHSLSIGDRITPEPYVVCGRCERCRTSHDYHNCLNIQIIGITLSATKEPYYFGGYSEYVYLPSNVIVHKVEPGTSNLAACLSSVVGNGVRWVKTLGNITFGKKLAISGAGSQGLCALAAAKAAGIGKVVILGLQQEEARFEVARRMGVDGIVQVDREDPVEGVQRILGAKADVVIETSGIPAAIKAALSMVTISGRVVHIGLSGGKITELSFDDLVWRDVSLIAGRGQAGNVSDAMYLINSCRYPFDEINNFHYRLDELDRALSDTEMPPPGFIKGVVVFE